MYKTIRTAAAVMAGGSLLTLFLTVLMPEQAARIAHAPAPAEQPPPPPPPKPQMPGAQVHATPGRVESFTFDSAALSSTKTVNLYLPPGYEQGNFTYPVVYLLRGHQSEWFDDVSSPSRKGRSARTIADELIMSGKLPPVILVVPPLSSDDRQIITLGINLANPRRVKDHPGIGPGRFEDFLVREVIPEVDRRFRTIPLREYRGVDGFSLGGFAAVSLGLRFPELFASVGAYEASFLWPGGRRADGKVDETIAQEMWVTFGNPPDLDLVQRYNPIDLIDRVPPDQLKGLAFHLQSAHPGSGDSARVAAVVAKLSEKGVTNSFSPPNIQGGKHGWYWADEHLLQALPKHLATFQNANK